jgi:hypothetical protein
MMTLTQKQIVGYMATVFVAGAVAGAALGYAYARKPPGPPPGPDAMVDHVRQMLKTELALTGEQVVQIEPLVRDTVTQMHAIRTNSYARVADVIRETDRRLEAFLTPAQKERLREFQRRRDDQFKRGGPDHGQFRRGRHEEGAALLGGPGQNPIRPGGHEPPRSPPPKERQ